MFKYDIYCLFELLMSIYFYRYLFNECLNCQREMEPQTNT